MLSLRNSATLYGQACIPKRVRDLGLAISSLLVFFCVSSAKQSDETWLMFAKSIQERKKKDTRETSSPFGKWPFV